MFGLLPEAVLTGGSPGVGCRGGLRGVGVGWGSDLCPSLGKLQAGLPWGLGVARAHLLRISGAGSHALGNFEEGVGH